ncbi:hypothetical protein RJ641_034273 [Dillenia turbinata]|uniref:Uncharacterized protein n=1 Tax=Dillenia turbinata TaxID=194707 RepID=A0AAN8VFL5_9MAGN
MQFSFGKSVNGSDSKRIWEHKYSYKYTGGVQSTLWNFPSRAWESPSLGEIWDQWQQLYWKRTQFYTELDKPSKIETRLSDIAGPEATFPPLSNMGNLKTLVLRSCSLTGQLPDFLGRMTNLRIL